MAYIFPSSCTVAKELLGNLIEVTGLQTSRIGSYLSTESNASLSSDPPTAYIQPSATATLTDPEILKTIEYRKIP